MGCSSILNDVKKLLGLDVDYKAFDSDVIIHINSAFSHLNQLGLGPQEGFMIHNEADQWDEVLGSDPNLNLVKTYVYLKTRLAFDPPTTSFAIEAIKEQLKEQEWRISILHSTSPSGRGNLHGQV